MARVKKDLGEKSESLVLEFLKKLGYRVVCRNYRCRLGEVDLIALDRGVIVFVEVRSRTGGDFGSPLETVGDKKQRQVARAALNFLSEKRLHGRDARFDVVGVTWDQGNPHIEHIRNAFELPSRAGL